MKVNLTLMMNIFIDCLENTLILGSDRYNIKQEEILIINNKNNGNVPFLFYALDKDCINKCYEHIVILFYGNDKDSMDVYDALEHPYVKFRNDNFDDLHITAENFYVDLDPWNIFAQNTIQLTEEECLIIKQLI